MTFFLVFFASMFISFAGLASAQGVGACAGFSNCSEVKYSISGETAEELTQQMEELGPGEGWGQTRVNFSDADTYTESIDENGRFFISQIVIEPELTITLPNWLGYSLGSPCMRASWDSMYSSLESHEKKHAEIGTQHSQQMEAAALSTAPQESSDALRQSVAAAIQPILMQHDSVQVQFDNSTDHGRRDPLDPVVLQSCN